MAYWASVYVPRCCSKGQKLVKEDVKGAKGVGPKTYGVELVHK